MSKPSFLEELRLLTDRMSIVQIVGLSGVIFYLHILGIREGLEPVGFVFNNPIDAAYVLTDIALAFAWAYLFEVVWKLIFVAYGEVSNVVKAKWKGAKPPILVSSMSDFDYAYDAWKDRVILTIIFYAWQVWLVFFIAIILLYAFRFLSRRFNKNKPEQEENPYSGLNDDEHQMLGTYLKRTLLVCFIASACALSYGIGIARIKHLTLREPTISATSQGFEYKGQVIYALSASFIIHDNEKDRFVVLPKSDTVIVEPAPQKVDPTKTDDALEELPPDRAVHHPALP